MVEIKIDTLEERLEFGRRYQDYIIDVLFLYGYIIMTYSSKAWQWYKGESRTRYEIKYDGHIKEGVFWIETAKESGCKSGIFKQDNAIFYVQGNWDDIYIFLKRDLQNTDFEGMPTFDKKPGAGGRKGYIWPTDFAKGVYFDHIKVSEELKDKYLTPIKCCDNIPNRKNN